MLLVRPSRWRLCALQSHSCLFNTECRNISEVSAAAWITTGRQSAHGAASWSSIFHLCSLSVCLSDRSASCFLVKWRSPISHAGQASDRGGVFREAKLRFISVTFTCLCSQQVAEHGLSTTLSAASAPGLWRE